MVSRFNYMAITETVGGDLGGLDLWNFLDFWISRTLLEVGVLKYLEGSMECRTRRMIWNCFGLS